MTRRDCPKCQGTMAEGFIKDMGHGAIYASEWVEGAPEQSFWTGGVKARGKEQRPVITFRCEKCGFLEFYAK